MEFFGLFKREKIGEPPYSYNELINIDEKEYPIYLKKIYKFRTNKNLNLKHPKTFNEKIQWLKLYDSTPIKTELTDKVLVRNYVEKKIGTEYLKPMLWVGKNFSDINFDVLPDKFIIKAAHGCKWQYIIKDKEKFINNKILMQIIKNHFDGWMTQSFFAWAGLEKQYRFIEPKILIEPLLRENTDENPVEYEVYCFNGIPKIFQKIQYKDTRVVSIFNKNFETINLKFKPNYKLINEKAEDNLKKAVELSKELAKDFKLARIDWILYKNHIYFNEITFTPFSGFCEFEDEKWNYKLGKMLDLNK